MQVPMHCTYTGVYICTCKDQEKFSCLHWKPQAYVGEEPIENGAISKPLFENPKEEGLRTGPIQHDGWRGVEPEFQGDNFMSKEICGFCARLLVPGLKCRNGTEALKCNNYAAHMQQTHLPPSGHVVNVEVTDSYDPVKYSSHYESATAAAKPSYKYKEDEVLAAVQTQIDGTYSEHYQIEEGLQLFDVWIADGTASTTFKNLTEKYLWRYGRKDGKNKRDILKAIHYLMMLLYVDHLKEN